MVAALSKSHVTRERKALIHTGFLSKEHYGGGPSRGPGEELGFGPSQQLFDEKKMGWPNHALKLEVFVVFFFNLMLFVLFCTYSAVECFIIVFFF